jgi:hypothetical protein
MKNSEARNTKNTRPFWATRTVPKKQRGVYDTNHQSQHERVSACEKGCTGPGAKDVGRERRTKAGTAANLRNRMSNSFTALGVKRGMLKAG